MAEDHQALALSWVFGASASIKHSVVNLSDGYTDKICYLAANTAVIYDKRLRRQVFLQYAPPWLIMSSSRSLSGRRGGPPRPSGRVTYWSLFLLGVGRPADIGAVGTEAAGGAGAGAAGAGVEGAAGAWAGGAAAVKALTAALYSASGSPLSRTPAAVTLGGKLIMGVRPDVEATGPVTAVAFSAVLPDRLAHADAADTLNRFMVPDFVVATRSSRIISVQAWSPPRWPGPRRDGLVPAEMVPDLMRSAGFYPSEADVDHLANHMAYMAHGRDSEAMGQVSFADLLCLYINHRPLFNVTTADIAAAFQQLGVRGENGKLQREQLLALLGGTGEAMSGEELAAALAALTGAPTPEKAMPPAVTAAQFSADVLGFDTDAVEAA
ncbi:WD repeat domain-containing protein [Tetrabaena socialis]|uniref:WD repeat domain-containing protein n=1 Tax=Tetrabaena socialis TaxID=47790 RepID=A0A2J8AIU8_9CHLO|nr:WD repeat domain-containing protein [Tetrabaena socialis]|eukprot:PNH12440.1 WD repeat domain-containing protein [Tetrabaena socialis]